MRHFTGVPESAPEPQPQPQPRQLGRQFHGGGGGLGGGGGHREPGAAGTGETQLTSGGSPAGSMDAGQGELTADVFVATDWARMAANPTGAFRKLNILKGVNLIPVDALNENEAISAGQTCKVHRGVWLQPQVRTSSPFSFSHLPPPTFCVVLDFLLTI